MTSDIFRHLANKNNEEIKVLSDDLARGHAKDHGEYKYASGIIRGLMIANSFIAEIAHKMETDDE
jgi:hypothetical protein